MTAPESSTVLQVAGELVEAQVSTEKSEKTARDVALIAV